MVTMKLIYGELVTPELFLRFDEHVWFGNTGITQFDYSNDEWHMVTWCDQAHLG